MDFNIRFLTNLNLDLFLCSFLSSDMGCFRPLHNNGTGKRGRWHVSLHHPEFAFHSRCCEPGRGLAPCPSSRLLDQYAGVVGHVNKQTTYVLTMPP